MTRAERFLALYGEHRLQDQRAYYHQRREEFERAQQQANLAAGLLMVLAAASAAAAGANATPRILWVVLAAILPATAGLGQMMQRLFAYERLAKLYEDAARALADVGAAPIVDGPDDDEMARRVGAYVDKVETILRKEQGQWGQLVAELKLEDSKG